MSCRNPRGSNEENQLKHEKKIILDEGPHKRNNANMSRTCWVRLLFFDKLKLVPLVLGSDPLLSQQPGEVEKHTQLAASSAALAKGPRYTHIQYETVPTQADF